MATPSQGLICCKECGANAAPHKTHKLFCEPCAKRKQVEYVRQYRERMKARPRALECKGCGKQFDASRKGRTWRCPECLAAYQAAYAQKDKARHAQYSRKYRARLGDEYRQRMISRRKGAIASMTPDQLAEFRRAEADKSRRIMAALREQIFAHYGAFCSCCGEAEPQFLTIDHVENNGAEMRRDGTHGRSGTAFYQWLRKQGFPAGFQTLCMNCNFGKHRNGGMCPHQDKV